MDFSKPEQTVSFSAVNEVRRISSTTLFGGKHSILAINQSILGSTEKTLGGSYTQTPLALKTNSHIVVRHLCVKG